MKKPMVKAMPEMVATFLVSTLMMARENSESVMRISPTGSSDLPIMILSGVFQSRFSGSL